MIDMDTGALRDEIGLKGRSADVLPPHACATRNPSQWASKGRHHAWPFMCQIRNSSVDKRRQMLGVPMHVPISNPVDEQAPSYVLPAHACAKPKWNQSVSTNRHPACSCMCQWTQTMGMPQTRQGTPLRQTIDFTNNRERWIMNNQTPVSRRGPTSAASSRRGRCTARRAASVGLRPSSSSSSSYSSSASSMCAESPTGCPLAANVRLGSLVVCRRIAAFCTVATRRQHSLF